MAEDTEATISVNGGPKVPLSTVKEALDIAQGRPTGSVAGDELRLLIERIERLEEEKKGLGEDITDVFNEAKSSGFDTKTMKRIIKVRKMEPHALQEAEALLDTYMNALGMTPIERAIALAA